MCYTIALKVLSKCVCFACVLSTCNVAKIVLSTSQDDDGRFFWKYSGVWNVFCLQEIIAGGVWSVFSFYQKSLLHLSFLKIILTTFHTPELGTVKRPVAIQSLFKGILKTGLFKTIIYNFDMCF